MYKVLILLFLCLIVACTSWAQELADLRMGDSTGGNSIDRKNSKASIEGPCTREYAVGKSYSFGAGSYYNFFVSLAFEEEDKNKPGPYTFLLRKNLPNPFNPATRIDYSLAKNSHVEITIFDTLGRKVDVLVDETKPAGEYSVVWYGTDEFAYAVEPGVYFYRLKAGDFVSTKKMVLQQ